ncbi:MAG: hypothetical protein SFV54_15980 [Bryobacteraceae bacterium]|nr:hypothetical protein [Bryobacteraceae bacterium]
MREFAEAAVVVAALAGEEGGEVAKGGAVSGASEGVGFLFDVVARGEGELRLLVLDVDEGGAEGGGALHVPAAAGDIEDDILFDAVLGLEEGAVGVEDFLKIAGVFVIQEEMDEFDGFAARGGALGAVGGGTGLAFGSDGAVGFGAIETGRFALGVGAGVIRGHGNDLSSASTVAGGARGGGEKNGTSY